MDDLAYGKRNKRGDWSPNEPIQLAPVFTLPPQPKALLRWLPHYFLPWNVIFALSAVAYWAWVIPSVETMQTLSWGWPLRLYAVNVVANFLFYGAFELHLYVLKRQERRFKYNGKFPSEQKSKAFWFESQNIDNILRTFLSGVTIWTAIEVLVLWAFANGYAPWLSFAQHPVYLFVLALLVPVIHEFHFFCIHRLIHTPFLYKWVHSVHHNSVNPSPWSSLSMHPVEHLLYLSTMFYHLIIPSNPIIALYQLHFAGFGAIPGHVGFDFIEVGENGLIGSHSYEHYLHHKYFEVNYGAALLPLDQWFGTWHDGSPDGEARMQERYRKRKERIAARQAQLAAAKGSARTMSGWVTACRLEDIEQEGVLRFDAGPRTFAIYRAPDDSVYCTDGLCTHEKVHLADGLVMDFEIECPKHAGAFDYRTGEALRLPPCVNLRTYPAEVVDGQVRIAID